jgi:TfoX/Sxy family transcriptional regulator of competence genes
MKTNRDVAQRVLDDVSAVAEARMRFMIGGWLVYVDDVLIGQIHGATLFVKETPFSTGFAPDLPRESPYDGARPAVVVPEDLREDPGWMSELVQGTLTDLRAATAKRGPAKRATSSGRARPRPAR